MGVRQVLRTWGVALVLAAWPSAVLAQAKATEARPANVVILLADDLGYGDLGAQGAADVATPNIDRLAKEGVRMTQFYANHPVCSPSRAALLTGKYQHRFGFENNSGTEENTSPKFGIPDTETTVAQRLKTLGYSTSVVGKWHVGFLPKYHPFKRGFDEFYGFLGGASAYTPDAERGGKIMFRGTERTPMPAHTTEAFAEEAVSFIERNKTRPFFLYVAFNAVHSPMQSTQPYMDRFASEPDPKRRAHLAMLAALDDAVGRIVAKIDAEGLGEQTLIVFTSDNGGPTWETTSSNGPLNGIKVLLLEGGIRVPAIFRQTGALPPGRVSDARAMGFDITATALAAAGAKGDKSLDGVDLRPYLAGRKSGDAHKALYWRSGGQGAMRKGKWKLLTIEDQTYLFDLEADLGERNNLADVRPDKVRELRADWAKWSGRMMAPQWVRNELAGGDRFRPGVFSSVIARFVRGEQVNLGAELGVE
jgi:arylsulfatase A-like enzyme